jgi:arylsulfatase A-like enzyme
MKTGLCLCSLALTFAGTQAQAQKKVERPNILWLTFEDVSHYMFGCYGNEHVHTPNVDRLAIEGIQYTNAWSNAPQSSPARSSLITGCYATTYGMDVHPVSYDTPDDILFPQLLRNAGYYCTNNNKTHYNTTVDNSSCWDEMSRKASYNSEKRAVNQPFFAVFNSVASHMGRVRTFHMDGRRDYTQEGIFLEKLKLPAHIPDLYEMRSDYAAHLEAVQDIDKWVGIFLDDLKEKGLEDNTIIFVFSDHGGCLPRGKGYLFESGLRVPMVAYFPPKWKHLASGKQGKDSSLVSFVDMGPTVLSLAGVKIPSYMQGKAFLGKKKVKEEKKIQFGFGANQLHHFMPMRAATDGRYKYLRNYIPYRRITLRNYYQWGMPANMAWDNFVIGGHNNNLYWQQPYELLPTEMLFDLETDPSELNNLAGNGEYADVLNRFRKEMSGHIRSTNDLGFFLPTSRENVNLYSKVRKEKYPLEDLHRIVELAGLATEADILELEKFLGSNYMDIRFWAIVGFSQLAMSGSIQNIPQGLIELMKSEDPYIAAEAAYACAYLGEEDSAIQYLLKPQEEENYKMGLSVLECLAKDKKMHSSILKYLNDIEWIANNLPSEQNEDPGLMARGILVDLGRMNIKDIYGQDSYEKGLKFNHGRRAVAPLPK